MIYLFDIDKWTIIKIIKGIILLTKVKERKQSIPPLKRHSEQAQNVLHNKDKVMHTIRPRGFLILHYSLCGGRRVRHDASHSVGFAANTFWGKMLNCEKRSMPLRYWGKDAEDGKKDEDGVSEWVGVKLFDLIRTSLRCDFYYCVMLFVAYT